MKTWKLGVVVAVLFAAAYGASPYWTVRSIRSAAQERDSDRLSTFIDFPSVRESVKSQLMAKFAEEMSKEQDNPFASLGQAMAAGLVGPMVDSLITPEGLARLLDTGKVQGAESAGTLQQASATQSGPSPEPVVTSGYKSLDMFTIEIVAPDATDKPVRFIFARHGLFSWKLTRIWFPV